LVIDYFGGCFFIDLCLDQLSFSLSVFVPGYDTIFDIQWIESRFQPGIKKTRSNAQANGDINIAIYPYIWNW
jgi:hypothetical protein